MEMKTNVSLCRLQFYLFVCFIVQIRADCLYPEWKKTCQKYCMDHQQTDIQFNQCYSDQVKCQCNGEDLTEKIRMLFQPTTTTSLASLSTSHSNTTNETLSCVANQSCVNGQRVCQTKYSFCICENEKWSSQICPQGHICKKDSSIVSCQLASANDDPGASSSSSRRRSITFSFLLCPLLIFSF